MDADGCWVRSRSSEFDSDESFTDEELDSRVANLRTREAILREAAAQRKANQRTREAVSTSADIRTVAGPAPERALPAVDPRGGRPALGTPQERQTRHQGAAARRA